MKKAAVLGILFVFMLVSAGAGLAQQEHGSSFDVFLGFGSEPDGDVGTGFGLGAGLNIPFTTIFNAGVVPGAADNLMIRADLSYFSWEGDTTAPFVSIDEEITRIPLFLGVRYFVSADNIKTEGLGIYAEIGIELSFDDEEVKTTNTFLGTSTKDSDDEINFGVPIGAGIQYYISEKLYLGLNARLHIISGSYFTLLGSIGFDL
jgi:opacity protein-like surface antigen